jgi:aldehyde dehydrogenase (NAD+)
MIGEANDAVYGLASGIYTSNLRNARRTADRLEAGHAWVNQYVNMQDPSPFGGLQGKRLGP